MQKLLAYRDGEFLPKNELRITLDDLGFERGFAVFDYCRERNGKIPFLSDHLQRLDHSQSLLRLQNIVEMPQVASIIERLQKENKLGDSYFKCIISARIINQKITAILTIYQDVFVPYNPIMFSEGISLILHEYERPFPEFKSTFYLASLREYARMIENGAEDVLFYFDDTIRECSKCNIFMIKGGLIYTPKNNILNGVTRHHLMLCAQKEFVIIEKDISVKELFEADEVFISSTTKNIMPVVKIEDRKIGYGTPGEISKILMQIFEQYCNHYVAE